MVLKYLKNLMTRENVWAFLLCLVILTVYILTAEQAPQWIYQGF